MKNRCVAFAGLFLLLNASSLLIFGAHSQEWGLFICGSMALTSLVFAWLLFGWSSAKSGEILLYSQIALLVGIICACALFYPGYINPHEPLEAITQGVSSGYSVFLKVIWVSILKFFPAPVNLFFLLCALQLLGFSIAVLFILRKIYRDASRAWQFFPVLFFLCLNPIVLGAQFFLTRSVIAGCINFLLWGWVFAVRWRKKNLTSRENLIFALLASLAIIIRIDIIPFVAAASLIFFGFDQFKKLAEAIAIIALLYCANFLLEKSYSAETWRTQYVQYQFQVPIIKTLQDISASGECAFSHAGADSEFYEPPANSDVIACAKKHFWQILGDRAKRILGFDKLPKWFEPGDFFRNPEKLRILLGARLLDANNEEEYRNRSPWNFIDFYEHPVTRIFFALVPLLLIALSISLFRTTPVGSALSLLMLGRFVFVLLSSYSIFWYYLEVHLWGCFLLIAVPVELKARSPGRPPQVKQSP